jgi:hypothetical protein
MYQVLAEQDMRNLIEKNLEETGVLKNMIEG